MSDKQEQYERLSAFIDAEQADTETVDIIDALLEDKEFRDSYTRMQLVNDAVNDQIDDKLLHSNLSDRISASINQLPAHFVESATQLQSASMEPNNSNWFNNWISNRLVSGVSVAASVMLVTIIALQTFDSSNEQSTQLVADRSLNKQVDIQKHGQTDEPLQHYAGLPQTELTQAKLSPEMVATAAGIVSDDAQTRQYQWIDADPVLSRRIREYINEHETHRTTFNLQPQIRAANYQISE